MHALISDLKDILALVEKANGTGEGDLSVCVQALSSGIETLSSATEIVLKASDEHALSVATPYLTLCGHIVSGALLMKSVANGLVASDPHANSMATLARYHAVSIMPQAAAQLDLIRTGTSAIFDFPVDQLADL